eukprot:scaffold13388_cov51-Cyclotella_meneghiniana.AAC.3
MATLLGHRCCSNTDGCSDRWMAVQQSPGAVCLVGLCSCYSGCTRVAIGQSSNRCYVVCIGML